MEEAFKGRDAHYEIRKLLNSYIRDLKDDFSESLLVNENLFSVLVNPIEQFNGAYIAKDFALSTDNFRASLQVLQRTVVKNKVLVVSMLDEMERFSQRAEPIFFLYDEPDSRLNS